MLDIYVQPSQPNPSQPNPSQTKIVATPVHWTHSVWSIHNIHETQYGDTNPYGRAVDSCNEWFPNVDDSPNKVPLISKEDKGFKEKVGMVSITFEGAFLFTWNSSVIGTQGLIQWINHRYTNTRLQCACCACCLAHSERRPQNIYSQEGMNLYCIIKLATEISLFSLQISKTLCFG